MANYYVLLTDYGKQVIANAHTATPIQLVSVVLGDANNQPYLPESRLGETGLVHETARVPVTRVKIVDDTTVEVTAIVASNIGGFNIHEIGIVDVTGKLVYVGNFHGGYRPLLTEGAGGDMELVFSIKAESLATVIIESDPTVVGASKAWVNERFTLLSQLMFPIGCKYWSHTPDNPKPLFDAWFGYPTFWRRLEGVYLLAVKDSDPNIHLPMMYVGDTGDVTQNNQYPDHYQGYTSYLWERYDPTNDKVRYDGQHKYDGTVTYQ